GTPCPAASPACGRRLAPTLGLDVHVPELAPGDRGAGLRRRTDPPEVLAGLHGLAEVRLAAPAEVVVAGGHVAQAGVLDRLRTRALRAADAQDHLVPLAQDEVRQLRAAGRPVGG